MDLVWGQWQVVVWVAPFAWAASSLIDVLLVDGRYYRNAVDGTIISTAFGATPCILIAIATGAVQAVDPETASLAFVAGLAFALHVYTYFGALFCLNDAAHVDTTFNANVAVVPILAYLLLDERLGGAHYAGIALAAIGVTILVGARKARKSRKAAHRRATALLVVGVLSLSLSLVLLAAVFDRCNYWTGLLWSSLGWMTGAVFVWMRSRGRGILRIARNHAGIFAINELVGALAVMGTLRATDLSPSVSLIPVIESTTPIIILFLSLVALAVMRLFPGGADHRSYAAFREQLTTAPRKLVATGFILAGVFVIAEPLPVDIAEMAKLVARSAVAFESIAN